MLVGHKSTAAKLIGASDLTAVVAIQPPGTFLPPPGPPNILLNVIKYDHSTTQHGEPVSTLERYIARHYRG